MKGDSTGQSNQMKDLQERLDKIDSGKSPGQDIKSDTCQGRNKSLR